MLQPILNLFSGTEQNNRRFLEFRTRNAGTLPTGSSSASCGYGCGPGGHRCPRLPGPGIYGGRSRPEPPALGSPMWSTHGIMRRSTNPRKPEAHGLIHGQPTSRHYRPPFQFRS